jgi:hypothetical protein
MQPITSSQCILRAMIAAEIADGCTRADLRESFVELSRYWLSAAEAAPADPASASAAQLSASA